MVNILEFEKFIAEYCGCGDYHTEPHPHETDINPDSYGRKGLPLHPVAAMLHTKWKFNIPNPEGYAPPHGHLCYVSDLIGRMEDINGSTTHTSQVIGKEHKHVTINGNVA